MRRRRCILHVGCPKTGTTYLQDILWGSSDALARQGFRMALDDADDHFLLTLALRGRYDPEVDSPRGRDVLERLARDLRSPRPEHVVISHELLASVEADRVHELLDLLDDYEVHVVITARDLARQIPAEWQQQVKTRAQQPYGRFVNRVVNRRARHFWAVQDVPEIAARWGRDLPPERVHVDTVPPRGSAPEVLLARFCTAIGLSPFGLSRESARMNQSLGYEQTELLRRVNIALGDRLPHPRDGYNHIVKFWFAEEVLAQQPASQPLTLPGRCADWCVSAAKDMVVHVEQAGYQVHGDLDELIPHCERAQSAPRPTDTEVAAASVEALATMLAERHRPGPRAKLRRAVRLVRAGRG
jgi:hypothetical protein